MNARWTASRARRNTYKKPVLSLRKRAQKDQQACQVHPEKKLQSWIKTRILDASRTYSLHLMALPKSLQTTKHFSVLKSPQRACWEVFLITLNWAYLHFQDLFWNDWQLWFLSPSVLLSALHPILRTVMCPRLVRNRYKSLKHSKGIN